MRETVDIAGAQVNPTSCWGDRFFLGTHKPGWLRDATVPLFISRRTLHTMKSLPVAVVPWALDSGGFTELQLYGRWTVDVADYIEEVRRYKHAIGRMLWAAPQDWMCEPQVIHGLVKQASCPHAACKGKLDRAGLCRICRSPRKRPPRIDLQRWLAWAREAGPVLAASVREAERFGDGAEVIFHGTGMSVAEHQRRTIENFVALRRLAPDINWIPVLQGWARVGWCGNYRSRLQMTAVIDCGLTACSMVPGVAYEDHPAHATTQETTCLHWRDAFAAFFSMLALVTNWVTHTSMAYRPVASLASTLEKGFKARRPHKSGESHCLRWMHTLGTTTVEPKIPMRFGFTITLLRLTMDRPSLGLIDVELAVLI